MTVRLAHFSDIHLTAPKLGWRPRDFASRRVSGWVNIHLLGRGRSFSQAAAVAAALGRAVRERAPDAVVFSGDATNLGFESEVIVAAAALGVADPASPPGIAVPGNHDYYTRRAARSGAFEAHFRPWQQGVRVDEKHVYPFARKIGHVWFIGLNSATPNFMHGDASGKVRADQLDRLRELCVTLDAGPRVLVTHYPLRTATGLVEMKLHRLRDHEAVLAMARNCGIGLWLHGHIHRGFVLHPSTEIPFPVVCVGSATQNGRWTFCEYVIDGHELLGTWRQYDPAADAFRDKEAFKLTLPGG